MDYFKVIKIALLAEISLQIDISKEKQRYYILK
jgi:hypothetical protein